MRNRLVIATFIVVLLGVIVIVPSCSQKGKMTELEQTITELEQTIAELQTTISEQDNTISELEAKVIEQDITITNLEAEKVARLSQAHELYDFATAALTALGELDIVKRGLYDLYFTVISKQTIAKSEADAVWVKINSEDTALKELYAPPEAIEAKNSILRQANLLNSLYGTIIAASIRMDSNWFDIYISEANDLLKEIGTLTRQNEIDLLNLQLQAEHDLK